MYSSLEQAENAIAFAEHHHSRAIAQGAAPAVGCPYSPTGMKTAKRLEEKGRKAIAPVTLKARSLQTLLPTNDSTIALAPHRSY